MFKNKIFEKNPEWRANDDLNYKKKRFIINLYNEGYIKNMSRLN